MMTFNKIDDSVYDKSATQIIYCKLFPLLIKDFLTRDGASEMMKTSNLPITVNPGQAVTTAGGPVAQSGSTISPGGGNTNPIYNGSTVLPADEIKAKEKKAIKDAGGQATGAVLDTALGG